MRNKTLWANHVNGTLDELLALSLEGLGIRLWANCVIIAASLVAVISNTFLITTIWKSKTLHSKCFILIAVNGLVDLLLGFGYAITGGKRIYRYIFGIGEVMTQWTCFCEIPMNVFFQIMSLAMTAALVIDRSIAIIWPIKYAQLSYTRLTWPLIISATMYTLIQFLANLYDSYMGPDEPTLFSCGIDDSVSDKMLIGLLIIQIMTSVAVVSLNCVLAAVIKMKHIKIRDTSNTSAREEKVFKTITLTVLLHIFVYLGGRLCILGSSQYLDLLSQALTNRYIRDLVVISAAANCFILFSTSSEFRAAAKKMVGCKNNAVGPLS